MQTIQGLLLGICFAGVLGGMIHLLSPGGSTDRILRLVVTLFILTAAIVPVRSLIRQSVSPVAEMRTDAAVDAVLQNAQTAIEQTARRVLDRYGYTDAQISITVCAENGEVHASRFVITGVPSEKAQEIAHEIFSLTGEMPCVQTRAAKNSGG